MGKERDQLVEAIKAKLNSDAWEILDEDAHSGKVGHATADGRLQSAIDKFASALTRTTGGEKSALQELEGMRIEDVVAALETAIDGREIVVSKVGAGR